MGPDVGPQPKQEAAYLLCHLICLPVRDHACGATRACCGRVLHADDANGAQDGLVAMCKGRHQCLWCHHLGLLAAVGRPVAGSVSGLNMMVMMSKWWVEPGTGGILMTPANASFSRVCFPVTGWV